jgi:lipopolysaccharide transport system permease protein
MTRHTLMSGVRVLVENRRLLRSLVARDVATRYRGTMFGMLWLVALPLLMLAVYAFVFGGIFKARWGVGGGLEEFVLMLYCGLIVHGLFSETLTRSPAAILANPNYVKKVVFPLELLPVIQLGSALLNMLIGLGLLCLFLAAKQQSIPPTALLAPLVLAPLVLLTGGLAMFLSALGVFFRDVGQMIGVVMSLMLFLSPVFYPAAAAPALARTLIEFNPLTFPIESLRQVMIVGSQPNWIQLALYALAALLVAAGGLWTFQKSRPAFSDVL